MRISDWSSDVCSSDLRVRYVIPTHVHLDHAGGAGVLMRALPNATLVVHERGARHLIDPAKLIAGASAVYGDAEVERMYGEIAGVPPVRVVSPQAGEPRSEERRVGEECVRKGRSRGWRLN